MLVLERRTRLMPYRFDQLADQITERVDPAKAGVERYVGLEHLDSCSLRIRRWGVPADVEATKFKYRPGDIIFGKRRFYQRKVAVAETEGICSAHAMVLRAKPSVVLAAFLPFFMQSDQFIERAMSISVGSLSPTINWKALAKEEFLLPPIQEQTRFVSALNSIEEVADSLFQMQDALRALLASLVDATAERGQTAGHAAPLNQLVRMDRPICYGILMPGTGHKRGVPVIKVRDYPDGEILEENLLLTSPEIDEEYRRSRLEPGDLIFSIRGTIGRVAVVQSSLNNSNITQDTARISLKRALNVNFVRAMLESSYVKRQVAAYTTGLAVKGINIGELRRLAVPLVGRAEQDDLVREIDDIREKLGAVCQRTNRIASLKAAMLSEIDGRCS